MQNDGDLLIDRKRLKRRLSAWRAVAILVLFGTLALFAAQAEHKAGGIGRDYIALYTLEGVMSSDPKQDELLEEIMNDDHAKALIVRMDSPGGTTVGGEETFLNFKKVAAKKPVVGVMRTLCASACYMASLGTDHVIAREGTLTGSIGVLLQSAEFSRLADKLGITPITIKSGRYKDSPGLAEPFAPDQRAVIQLLIDDAYAHFVGMIVKRRNMTEAHVRELADGRVYTGSQALKLNLIDGIGGQDEAVAWLAIEKKINPKLEVREIKADAEIDSVFQKLIGYTGIKIFGKSMVGLDGLVSIWQHPLM